jgi:ADP-ribose pyrophosphatase YjhB (NUDIX family)
MTLQEELRLYRPWNEQEAADRALMEHCLDTEPDLFSRENPVAHFTASAWVVNSQRTRVLLAHHNLYRSWSWLGGHADGQRDLLQTALREVREESGLRSVRPADPRPFSLEVLAVAGHVRRGAYVPSHLHLNVTYLLEADESEPLRPKPDENSAVAWFSPEEAVAASSEPWFQERIYPKLNAKLKGEPPTWN